MNWDYGKAHERYPIEAGEVWITENGRGKVAVHDLYNPLPQFMLEADMIICDPPWNLSNVNTFYTKADKKGEHTGNYNSFYHALFSQIDVINPKKIYLEIGKQNVDKFNEELSKRYKFVEVFPVTYYKVNPCFLIRASNTEISPYHYSGMDEWDAILKACEIEEYNVVADLCMGRGLVGVGAYTNNKSFVGTELNKKRLACLIEKLSKEGAIWTKEGIK